mmetsp:Transcript_9343/g.17866  ORF Transcript_9343/g.17866 Transcript_9343/m.17866 type:complete len:277 (-) Transcript_9343:32-862(-)
MQQTFYSFTVMILVAVKAPYLCSAARIFINSDAGNVCGAVQRAVARVEKPSECKCPKWGHKVFCVDTNEVAYENRKFKPATIFEVCGGGGAYCAKKPKKRSIVKMTVGGQVVEHIETESSDSSEADFSVTDSEDTPNLDEQEQAKHQTKSENMVPPSENMVPPLPKTTTVTTTSGPDLAMWVDAAPLFKVSNSNFKCCEHSAGDEAPRIQHLRDSDLPKKRTYCADKTGCGCMFGDKWHNCLNVNKKASGKCRVRLGYLAVKMGVPPKELEYLRTE